MPREGAAAEQGQYLTAMVARVGEGDKGISMPLQQPNGGPHLLLPGRYRVTLVAVRQARDGHDEERTPLGPAEDVELVAGETRRVQLR